MKHFTDEEVVDVIFHINSYSDMVLDGNIIFQNLLMLHNNGNISLPSPYFKAIEKWLEDYKTASVGLKTVINKETKH